MDELLARLYQSFPNLTTVSIAGHSAGGQFAQRYASTRNDPRIAFVVSAPSSYLYMDAARPGPTCSRYNEYKYGLDALIDTPYMAALGASTIRDNYQWAKITYVVGENDVDPLDPSLDVSCQAMAQGAVRVQRAQEFYAALGRMFGAGIYATQSFEIIPGVAHEGRKLLNSGPSKAVLRR